MKNYNAKPQEIEGMEKLLSKLSLSRVDSGDLSYFFINYQIPQISKEFDLLRFGDNYNINIELKSSISEIKIYDQLLKNRYYLSSLNETTYYFSFETTSGNLYFLNNTDELEEISISALAKYLKEQQVSHIDNIDKLFTPSKYLVSPFSIDDNRFITDKYFLNGVQNDIKKKVLSGKSNRIKITGKPGTGKSLLIYDIAKELMKKGERVSIIHAGLLNSGHRNLKDQYGWKIYPAYDLKYDRACIKCEPDCIIIDEAQRLYLDQFKEIKNYISGAEKKVSLIVSYDVEQVLSKKENLTCLASILESEDKMRGYEKLILGKKIRTNPDLAKFIEGLFDLRKMTNVKNTEQVAIQYFSKNYDAQAFAKNLSEDHWKLIDYTVPKFRGEDIEEMVVNNLGSNAHKVIGQDFEKVVAIIGENFYYNEERKLAYKNSRRYSPEKMLYQIVTRARSSLILVIVNNEKLLGEIVSSLATLRKNL